MISSYDFRRGPWQDPEWMLAEADKFYAEKVTPKGLGDRYSVTKAKIIERRKWTPALPLIDQNFEDALRDLNIVYVPKQLAPGPCFIFPQRDLYPRFTFGKINPLYDLVLMPGADPVKYSFLGQKESIIGPPWFGNTDQTLIALGKTKKALIVEGYFDLLACRVLMPGLPVLSTGTKNINDEHVQYLQMLGVEEVYFMFDNEAAKEGKEIGAGNQAMAWLAHIYGQKTSLKFQSLACPNDDASMCLEHYRSAFQLQRMLEQIFGA